MRYCFLIVSLFSAISLHSQIVRVENAKYFDNNHELYNGIYTEYYDNGNKKLEMFLLRGEQDSTTTLYFENGAVKETRSYKQGLMQGKWETFNSAGIKIAEAWFRND